MSIKVECSACKTQFTLNDSLAGKKAQCSKCKGVIQIPEAVKKEEQLIQESNKENFQFPEEEVKGETTIAENEKETQKTREEVKEEIKSTGKSKMIKIIFLIFSVIFFIASLLWYFLNQPELKEKETPIPAKTPAVETIEPEKDISQDGYPVLEKILTGLSENHETVFFPYVWKSKCLLEVNDSLRESACKKEQEGINVMPFEDIEKQIRKIQMQLKILSTKEYIYLPEGDEYSLGQEVDFITFMSYFRVVNYLAIKNIEQGNIERGLDIFVQNQDFLNIFMTQIYDQDGGSLITIYGLIRRNLEGIIYVTENFDISDEQYSQLIESVKQISAGTFQKNEKLDYDEESIVKKQYQKVYLLQKKILEEMGGE
ncbi:MAG: hypothetical protein GY828_01530 [Candidatus Gracilibacteria bacterium]|nr:hypothetical protein [Candidatus Gracilibacteria bacterium]